LESLGSRAGVGAIGAVDVVVDSLTRKGAGASQSDVTNPCRNFPKILTFMYRRKMDLFATARAFELKPVLYFESFIFSLRKNMGFLL
jgi:hypothetical protein